MWIPNHRGYDESSEPKFLEFGNDDYARYKQIDLKGKFLSFYAFGQQNNHINAFAMGIFKKIQLPSNSDYKNQLFALISENRTFCNVVARCNTRIDLGNYEGVNQIVQNIFEDSFRSFDSMNFPGKYNDFEHYRGFGENTFSLRILSKLFGVSSVVYKEISFYDKEPKIEIILPDLQNYRPTLYFYAFANEFDTYNLYTMISKVDSLEERQTKKIVRSKKNSNLGKYMSYSKNLLEYFSSINDLYNKVLRNYFNVREDIRKFDKEIQHDLDVIRANRKANRLEFVLSAYTGSEKLNAKILKYKKLNLHHICSFCFGMDTDEDKVFSLDCLCLFHKNCYLKLIKKSGYNFSNLTCFCGNFFNHNFYLNLVDNEDNKNDAVLFIAQNFQRMNCDICGMDSSNSFTHSNECPMSLCESCNIKMNNKQYNCKACKKPYEKKFELNGMNFLCTGCHEMKIFFEMFIPEEDENPVGCYECYINENFGKNPKSLSKALNNYKIDCKNTDCISNENKIEAFIHPGKKSCPQCKQICYYCIMNSNGICPLCTSNIEIIPNLF